MQVIGWISILVGLLYLRTVSGVFLIIIGSAVVYVVGKIKKSEVDLMRNVFQTQIKNLKGLKKVLGIAKHESGRDVPANILLTKPNSKPKGGKKQKPDWFIYTK
jgi:hypothetical protein